MTRPNDRQPNQLRPISFETNYTKWAEGSVLTKFGDTHVLCTASVEDRVPPWLHRSKENHGWITAEYGMLPRSTSNRIQREQRWPKGRTQEIERLIGRSLRMAVNLYALGQRQIIIDCDVIQADGGTRTAAITGGWLALKMAIDKLVEKGKVDPDKIFKHQVAAVSVGIVDKVAVLDLEYTEDVKAGTDLNVVMTGDGRLIEVQGTGEKAPFNRRQLDEMLDLAEEGIQSLLIEQVAVL